MRRPSRTSDWAELLRRIAGPVPPLGSALGAGRIDALLLSSIHGVEPDAALLGNVPDSLTTAARPEDQIWMWRHRDEPTLTRLIVGDDRRSMPSGPLLPPPRPPDGGEMDARAWLESTTRWAARGWPVERWTIETWTEAELASLQAVMHHLTPDPKADLALQTALRSRLAAARAWHIEHTQPDNSTNRPWAIPVFLVDLHETASVAATRDERDDAMFAAECRLYAETLLHNALAQGSQAGDPLRSAILHDAARLLDRNSQDCVLALVR